MAIDSLRDGFVRLCFDPSANVIDQGCRLVIEGQFYDPGAGCSVVPDKLVKVTSVRDIDCHFGAGSVLAESLKVAISCCGNGAVEVFALPREDAVGAVAAVYEVTVAGTALTDGRVDIFWGDARYNISVRVFASDTAASIATAVAGAIPDDFPYEATVSGDVITLTARNGGTVGNYLVPQFNWHNRNNYAPVGVSLNTAQTVVGSGDPEPANYAEAFGECCVCCLAILSGADAWQDGAIAYLDDAWSCDKPQCFGHGYTYNAGSLGQILASDTNSATVSRMAHGAQDPSFPWLKVAAYAGKSCCITVDNPEISVEGENFGVLECLGIPESCVGSWTFDEMEQLREAGFVVTVPLTGGQGAITSPMVTNDITNNRFDAEGRENATFRSVSSRRGATKAADMIARELRQFQGLGYFTDGTNIAEGTRGTNRRMILGRMRAWARSQVGVLFSQFDDIDNDIQLRDDFETAPRCQGVPGKLYLDFTYRPPVRIQQVVVNARPRVLNNC